MNNQVDKHSGAMRIFEALSSVDEELLERSEEKAKVIPFRKATRIMAACAGLLLVGVVTWTGMQTYKGSDNASCDCAAPESMKEMAAADAIYPEEEQNNMDVETVTGTEYAVADGDAPAEAEEESMLEADVESAKVTNDELDEVKTEGAISENQNVIWDSESVPVQQQEALSEEKLREVGELGDYIPTVLPEGYVFESGYQTAEGGIHVCWSKGMDTIMFSVLMYEENEENEKRIVDISKPETYDVHMYEIPYASTVPEEYWSVFSNPIFDKKDFSLGVVQARVKSVADSGDTDTPRGNFEVLYGNRVLVHFSGDADAEQIWEMFETIGE